MSRIDEVSGYIAIDPPIPYSQFRGTPYASDGHWETERRRVVWLDVREEAVETDEGPLLRKIAHGIRVTRFDEVRADSLLEEVRDIYKSFPVTEDGQPYSFKGVIQVIGEQPGDIWRVIVGPAGVDWERVNITWPDGSRFLP